MSSYQIVIGKYKTLNVEVQLENRFLAVPPHVSFGVGDKAARYKKHLDACLSSDNQDALRHLAFIHKQGKEHGHISLLCNCKSKAFHSKIVKEWIEEHRETLDMMLPYLFTDEGYKVKKVDISELSEEERQQLSSKNSNNEHLLSQEDRNTIMALIKQDQERENNEKSFVNEEVIIDNQAEQGNQ